MPLYQYACSHCTHRETKWSTISRRYERHECLRCGSGFLEYDLNATIKTVHTAPVPGTGNWSYARKLEEKAKRVETTPGSEKYIAADQQAWREKHG